MHISSPQGKFQGLDLNEELHVGGYPNYTLLAKTAGIKTGFVGKTPLCLHCYWEFRMQIESCPHLMSLLCRLHPSAHHPR